MVRFTNMFCWYYKKLPADETITVTLNNWDIRKSKDGWATWIDNDGNKTKYII